MARARKKAISLLQEFSVPLIGGVIVSLIWANLDPHSYHEFLHHPLTPFSDKINFHFLVNDIFMVFFFGIAAVEITQSVLPGGDLNPPSRALSPLLATMGGIFVPIAVYFLLNWGIGEPDWAKGWGIPTATDIALAWLVARAIFGAKHAAVSFLLLLAIADDAIGLVIIAVFYPNPAHPPAPAWLILVLVGMVVAFFLRKRHIADHWAYLACAGLPAWTGLLKAGVHPALSLVFIVPFMPTSLKGAPGHLFENYEEDHSTLAEFEHAFKGFVDFGLFGFGLANAGVSMSGVTDLTWIVLGSLIVGKTFGVWGFAVLGQILGIPLPKGMNARETLVVGMIAGVGLTVALFVSGVAFQEPELQGAAKMGALLSGAAAFMAFFMAAVLGIRAKR